MCWIPFKKEGGLSHCIMHNDFNYALKQTESLKPILFSISQNDFGITITKKGTITRFHSMMFPSFEI